jgi:ADP-L-glycero-D-manno-heptose 6-epimerase
VAKIERDQLEHYLAGDVTVDFVVHFGARTDTTEMDYSVHEKLNVIFSKMIWNYCTKKQIPLIYASSAATYGDGAFGYEDNEEVIEHLQPLNPYGVSKNEFDKWAVAQAKQTHSQPPYWYALKFFNVYGPGENHKGRMASVIFHAFQQIRNTGKMGLFRSHHPDYPDGGQKRDFIYVKDIFAITWWLLQHLPQSGIYNAGTGHAQTFLELAYGIFKTMGQSPAIEFRDTPLDIRDKYQYFTEANMSKLRNAGYEAPFYDLENGIDDYVKNYLQKMT